VAGLVNTVMNFRVPVSKLVNNNNNNNNNFMAVNVEILP
jgi:hypothetical protein